MKTPHGWKLEFQENLENFETDYVAMIEAIQRDALTDTMADTTAQQEWEMTKSMCEKLEENIEFWKAEVEKMRQKWLEARRYLRAANKGAQRNAEALALCQNRYWDLVVSDKRRKERDTNQHKTIVWNWMMLSDEDFRRKFGDPITNEHIYAFRILLKEMLGTSILRHL